MRFLGTRRLRPLLALTAAAALTGALLVPPAAGAGRPATASTSTTAGYQHYVALGDSFASLGALTKLYVDAETGCMRSTDNYPARVNTALAPAAFTDATCAGAKTDGVLGTQLDALTPDTDLVTLTISGNDIGFVDILTTCASLSLTNPFGNPCQRHYTGGGTDELADTIVATAPKVDAVLAGIAERAPNARVVVTSYLRIMPSSLGCWPLMPMSIGDVGYINGVQDQLNAMVGTRAQAAGATFVDVGRTSGHDACQLPWNRYVDGVLPLANAIPVHPTPSGQAYVSASVLGALRAG
jgi:lysophospholipase L1-like esterase